MRRQNEIIENCKRTVAETEEIGIETIAELQNNREKIESARAKVTAFHAPRVATDAYLPTIDFLFIKSRAKSFTPWQMMLTNVSNRCGLDTRPGDCLVRAATSILHTSP